ncbi:unnamed protein product, partial [Adineta steineri]
VKSVVTDLDELVSQITRDHKIQKKVEEPLSINIFTTNVDAGKSTTGVNGEFVFSQILIDCLLRLKSTEIDKNELINLCENEYVGNYTELNNLREFQQSYSPNEVLWWYTKETFFYKTLNAALRTQNIHLIFLFRAYIYDIYHQLQKYQSKKFVRVYRCQLMSNDEINSLKQNIDQFISINSFFSTTDDRSTALFLLGDLTTQIDSERVLFEIEADPKVVTTKPFANISKHSDFPDESEVLFMIGSIFRLNSIDHNDDQIWIIKMTLCDDDEHDLKQVLMYMKQQIENEEINLRTLGKLLWKMGKLDLAEKYFNRLLQELPSNDPLLSNLYEDLGELASQTGDYDMSVQWHQKSLAIKNKNQLTVNPTIKKTNNSIVLVNYINNNTKWKQHGITIAGGNGSGNQLNQLYCPFGIYIDHRHQTIYIADWGNHRIVEWKYAAKTGQVVAGGNEIGKRSDQLHRPTDVIVDKRNDSLIICDGGNRRVVRWSRQNDKNGETIISDIDCSSLAMDNNGDLYVSDHVKNEVRRWKQEEREGTIVAGGNGQGKHLNQLQYPIYIFVDEDHSVYVSDHHNHRVMKWMKGAKEGIIVAGGQGGGNSLKQLSSPCGVIVDHLGNVYVADSDNHRIMRWCEGSCEGSIVVGGNGEGEKPNQFSNPVGLSFDVQGNLYVADWKVVEIEHDGETLANSWFLDDITIEMPTKGRAFCFACHEWLSKEKGDGETKRILKVQDSNQSSFRPYKQHAGTTQHGWIIIEGNKKRSEKFYMKNEPHIKILRGGQTDTFTFECRSLGELRRIILGHKERPEYPLKTYEGRGAMWHVAHVIVTDPSIGVKFEFPVRKWMDINNDGDVFECAEKKEDTIAQQRHRHTIKYKIIVHTGDVSYCGTDANVSIILYGTLGGTGIRKLKQKGKLTRLHIEHDNSTISPDWFLDKVEVINIDINETISFSCNRWLASSFNQPKFRPTVTWNANGITFANQSIVGQYPSTIFVSTNNTIYATNPEKNTIVMWQEESVNPTKIISSDFKQPLSLFVTSNGGIYIDDGHENGRVQRWNAATSTFVTVMNVISSCTSLFVDIHDTLYCSMYYQHQVLKTSLNDTMMNSNVVTAAGIGIQGSASNQLDGPFGIFVDVNLDLYVADCYNDRVQLFQSGELHGVTVAGSTSLNPTITLRCPTGIILDADKYLFIVDFLNSRIVGSDLHGFRCLVGCYGQESQSNQLANPVSFSFDSYGNMFVSDQRNSRIQKFLLMKDSFDLSFNQPK